MDDPLLPQRNPRKERLMTIAWPIAALAMAQIVWWTGVVKNSWEPLIYGIGLHFLACGVFIGWALSA